MIQTVGWLMAVVLTVLVIMTHYRTLVFVSDRIIPWAQRHGFSRGAMAWAAGGLIIGHLIEIALFAFGLALAPDAAGTLQGGYGASFEAYLRLSAASYATVGAALPQTGGSAVILMAIEPIVGLMMFAWSASFAVLKMQTIWERRKARRE